MANLLSRSGGQKVPARARAHHWTLSRPGGGGHPRLERRRPVLRSVRRLARRRRLCPADLIGPVAATPIAIGLDALTVRSLLPSLARRAELAVRLLVMFALFLAVGFGRTWISPTARLGFVSLAVGGALGSEMADKATRRKRVRERRRSGASRSSYSRSCCSRCQSPRCREAFRPRRSRSGSGSILAHPAVAASRSLPGECGHRPSTRAGRLDSLPLQRPGTRARPTQRSYLEPTAPTPSRRRIALAVAALPASTRPPSRGARSHPRHARRSGSGLTRC